MSTPTQDGRPTAEATGTPVVPVVRASAVPSTVPNDNYPRPHGATPLYPAMSLLPDSDPQDMGDAMALDAAILAASDQSYRFRWHDYLGRDGAA